MGRVCLSVALISGLFRLKRRRQSEGKGAGKGERLPAAIRRAKAAGGTWVQGETEAVSPCEICARTKTKGGTDAAPQTCETSEF